MPSIGVRWIELERQRQIETEGYTVDHDVNHGADLIMAAAGYLFGHLRTGQSYWPWDHASYKPTDLRRNLIKAGALIAAFLDADFEVKLTEEESA